MVQGNWQRRAEKAEARRTDAKQRKQQKGSRGVHKAQVLELFAWLDNASNIRSLGPTEQVMQIWVESKPSGGETSLDQDDFAITGAENAVEAPEKTGRQKKAHPRGTGKQKRAHPRSHAATHTDDTMSGGESRPSLCRRQFFTGTCDGATRNRKKGSSGLSCSHEHYPPRNTQRTLADVLLLDSSDKSKSLETLKASSEASIISATTGGSAPADQVHANEAMEMVYHLAIPPLPIEGENDESNKAPSWSERISGVLSTNSCSIGDIVYFTHGNYLIFDRYREGILPVETKEGRDRLDSLPQDSETAQDGSIANVSSPELDNKASSLPCHILEYILTFLPDDATGMMCRVCKGWYDEVGKHSPDLWKFLLKRRNWPLLSEVSFALGTEENSEEMNASPKQNSRDHCRETFTSHYSAFRDMNAVAKGIISMAASVTSDDNDSIVHTFSTRRFAPTSPNECVGVRIWSEKRALIAYRTDCTIRLFDVVPMRSTTEAMSCREAVCVRVAPFPNTKKRSSEVIAMDLVNEIIGCLCKSQTNDPQPEYFLTAISREDFLCAGGGADNFGIVELEEGALTVIHIRDVILEHLLDLDFDEDEEETDYLNLDCLHAFIASRDDDYSDVSVNVSNSLVACGNHRFMMDASISIPRVPDADDDNESTIECLFRWIFVLSTQEMKVVWTTKNMWDNMAPRESHHSLVSLRSPSQSHTNGKTTIAVASAYSPFIFDINIGRNHDSLTEMRGYLIARQQRNMRMSDGWDNATDRRRKRPLAIVGEEVITVDNLEKFEDGKLFNKSVVYFYSRGTETSDSSPSAVLTLEDNCHVTRVEPIRDEHAMLLCHERAISTTNQDIERDVIFFILLHTKTRQVIARFLLNDAANLFHGPFWGGIPIFFDCHGDSVVVGVGCTGIILTGHGMRTLQKNDNSSITEHGVRSELYKGGSTKKKKKKRQQTGGGKKDGFARGMSQGG